MTRLSKGLVLCTVVAATLLMGLVTSASATARGGGVTLQQKPHGLPIPRATDAHGRTSQRASNMPGVRALRRRLLPGMHVMTEVTLVGLFACKSHE
jgi:hypothetical protein